MRWLCAIILLSSAVYSLPVLPAVSGEKELVELQFQDVLTSRQRRAVGNNGQHYPEYLQFTFNVSGIPVSIHLEINERIGANPPVYVIQNGEITKKDMEQSNYALYQDINTGSAMLVTCLDDRPETCQMHGSFRHQSEMYYMTPSSSILRDEHTVQQLVSEPTDYGIDAMNAPADPHEGSGQFNNVSETRKKRDISGIDIIELLACPDESVYEFYLTSEGSDSAAEVAMQLHYSLLVNEIDLHYLSVAMVSASMGYTLDIRLYLAGVLIAKKKTHAQWSADHEHTIAGETYLDANKVLLRFSNWINNMAGIPANDHAMAFSRKNLALVTDGVATKAGIAGQAWLSQVCRYYSQSIVEDGGLRTSTIAAHEVGHSLSAHHDGSSTSAGCPSGVRNIMTPTVYVTVTSEYAEVQWTFSTCSIAAFKSHKDGYGQCMSSHSFTEAEYTSSDSRLPGEVYSITQQCQLNNYVSSCDTAASETDCHSGIHCNSGNGCYESYYPLYVMAGTPCGNPADNKWCYRGRCVEKTSVTTSTTTTSPTTTTTSPTTTTTSPITTTSPTTTTTSPTTTTTSPTTTTTSPITTTSPTTTTTSPTTTTTSPTTTSPTTTTTSPTTTTTSPTTTTIIPTTTSSKCNSLKCCKKKKKITKCCIGMSCCGLRWRKAWTCCKLCKNMRKNKI